MEASFSFDGCEARRGRARPSKETLSSVTNFWLVLSFRAAAYTRGIPLNIPPLDPALRQPSMALAQLVTRSRFWDQLRGAVTPRRRPTTNI